jgi:hypothetical protein
VPSLSLVQLSRLKSLASQIAAFVIPILSRPANNSMSPPTTASFRAKQMFEVRQDKIISHNQYVINNTTNSPMPTWHAHPPASSHLGSISMHFAKWVP